MASIDWVKTTARQDEKHLSFGIWCASYIRDFTVISLLLHFPGTNGLISAQMFLFSCRVISLRTWVHSGTNLLSWSWRLVAIPRPQTCGVWAASWQKCCWVTPSSLGLQIWISYTTSWTQRNSLSRTGALSHRLCQISCSRITLWEQWHRWQRKWGLLMLKVFLKLPL